MRKDRTNVFARRGSDIELIKAGGVFRYRGPENLVETAQVLGITSDATGIPHVRYQVMIERPYLGRMIDGPRILNLRSFVERFSERLMPVPAHAAE
jgi:hypothetical protein